jgi:hypothetical protein
MIDSFEPIDDDQEEDDRLFLLEVLYNRPGHREFMHKHNGNLEAMFKDPEFQQMLKEQEQYLRQDQH